MQAKYLTELERNGRKFDAALTDLKASMERRDTEAARHEARLEQKLAERDTETARRDKDNLRSLIGLWVAAIVFMGVLIRRSLLAPPFRSERSVLPSESPRGTRRARVLSTSCGLR